MPQKTGKISVLLAGSLARYFDEDKKGEIEVCGECIIPTDTVSYVQAHSENTKDTLTGDTLRVSTSSQMTSCKDNMKTV